MNINLVKNVIIIIVLISVSILFWFKPSYYKTIIHTSKWIKKLPYLLSIIVGIFTIKSFSSRNSEQSPNESHIQFNIEKRNVTETTKKIVASKQQWKCGMCHRLLDETYEVDHIIPLYKGGSNEINNLMALDPICHRKKTYTDKIS